MVKKSLLSGGSVSERDRIVGVTWNQMDHDFDSFALTGHTEGLVDVGQVKVMRYQRLNVNVSTGDDLQRGWITVTKKIDIVSRGLDGSESFGKRSYGITPFTGLVAGLFRDLVSISMLVCKKSLF